MTLWTLLQAVLLFVNGLAVLNNERFLEPYGWGFNNMAGGGHSLDSGKPGALKQQTIGLLHAIAYLRVSRELLKDVVLGAVPLIVTNALVILVKLLFG